jgi:hypothetical protein
LSDYFNPTTTFHFQSSVEEWLFHVRLSEYEDSLKTQGYNSIQEVARISVEDLEDIGIFKLGHQKRFLLGIKRIKDLRNRNGKLATPQSPGRTAPFPMGQALSRYSYDVAYPPTPILRATTYSGNSRAVGLPPPAGSVCLEDREEAFNENKAFYQPGARFTNLEGEPAPELLCPIINAYIYVLPLFSEVLNSFYIYNLAYANFVKCIFVRNMHFYISRCLKPSKWQPWQTGWRFCCTW